MSKKPKKINRGVQHTGRITATQLSKASIEQFAKEFRLDISDEEFFEGAGTSISEDEKSRLKRYRDFLRMKLEDD